MNIGSGHCLYFVGRGATNFGESGNLFPDFHTKWLPTTRAEAKAGYRHC